MFLKQIANIPNPSTTNLDSDILTGTNSTSDGSKLIIRLVSLSMYNDLNTATDIL